MHKARLLFVIITILSFNVSSFAGKRTIISGSIFSNTAPHKSFLKIYKIWNLFMEGAANEFLIEDSTDLEGNFFSKFTITGEEVLVFVCRGYRLKLYMNEGDSLNIKIKRDSQIVFSGKGQIERNKYLLNNAIVFKDSYIEKDYVSDSTHIFQIIDSIKNLLKIDPKTLTPYGSAFNNYTYAELIGKQYVLVDFMPHIYKYDSSILANCASIWKEFPVVGKGSSNARAYVNSLNFSYPIILKSDPLKKDYPITGYTFQKGRLKYFLEILKNESDLLNLFIPSNISSLIYLSTNLNEFNDALSIKDRYKMFIKSKYVRDNIDREISRKKIALNLIKAPSFSLIDINNNIKSLYQTKSNYILLDFWATWCVPCVREILEPQDSSEIKAELSKIYICINDDKTKWKSFILKNNLKGNFLFATREQSEKLKGQYGFDSVPQKVLIDQNFNIISMSDEYIKSFLPNIK